MSSHGGYRSTLRFPGLQPFLWTQFLGALNDNVLKIVASLLAMETLGPIKGSTYVAGALLLPFVLFSGYAGALADRLSKRSVLVTVKVFELAIMAVATVGLLTRDTTTLLVAVRRRPRPTCTPAPGLRPIAGSSCRPRSCRRLPLLSHGG